MINRKLFINQPHIESELVRHMINRKLFINQPHIEKQVGLRR